MIDFHSHRPTRMGAWGARSVGAAEYVEFMDGADIDISVTFTIDGLLRPDEPDNDAVAEYVAAAPERLVGFGSAHPRSRHAVAEVERSLAELGMRGLKFHPWVQGFAANEKIMDPICEVAAGHGVPILLHDGTPPYATPLQAWALARRHPDTTIVLGHGGLHDMWREAIVAVNDITNLWLCMCGLQPYAMRHVVASCPLDRLLFGTDGGLAAESAQAYAALRVRQLRTLGLSASEFAAISDVNPRRLLGLPETLDVPLEGAQSG